MSKNKVFCENAINTTRFTTLNVFQSIQNIERCDSNRVFYLFINVQHDRIFRISTLNTV